MTTATPEPERISNYAGAFPDPGPAEDHVWRVLPNAPSSLREALADAGYEDRT